MRYVLCRQSLMKADTEQFDGGSTDEESLRHGAESLMCDELMWLSDDESTCCPR